MGGHGTIGGRAEVEVWSNPLTMLNGRPLPQLENWRDGPVAQHGSFEAVPWLPL